MKIAIDTSQIVYGTGVSSYTRNLVLNLLKIDRENKYLLFAGSLRRKAELALMHKEFSGAEVKITSISPSFADLVWNRLHVLPIEKIIGKVDILHTSDWSEPPSSAYKVTTIHDLSPFVVPKETPKRIVETFQRKLGWVKKESQKIIVPTNATKEDLIKNGFDEGKIEVIYEGLDPVFKKQVKVKKEDYLLCVGTASRKNLDNIHSAFIKLRQKGVADKMLIVGREPVNKLENVSYTGYISQKELLLTYAKARVLVYASLYEGFGLPILEAYSQDTPVVTSNFGSLKEVSGSASVLVDPLDVSSIEDGVIKAINNKEALATKGRIRLKDFSWEKAAKQTLKIYENAK